MKKLLVIGAGESGVGAAKLGAKLGYTVLVSDFGTVADDTKQLLRDLNIELEETSHEKAKVWGADLAVKSPGIPFGLKWIQDLMHTTEVIDEIEFAYRNKGASKVVAITGSNGKTTTTLLTNHVMHHGGLKVGLAGNVGASWAGQLADGLNPDVWVLELSSFQLEGLKEFRSNISIITNITPDHLDRYTDFDHYADTKLSLFRLTTDACLYWNGDEYVNRWVNKNSQNGCGYWAYGDKNDQAGAWQEEDILTFNIKDNWSMSIEELALTGKHNVANTMAAGLAGKLMELRKESIRDSLKSFENVEHRLEFVAEVQGVEFTNDSKSTNVNAAWYALDSANKPLVWIAGGVDKGNDYTSLLELAKLKVKALVVLGTDNEKMVNSFKEVVPVILEASSMDEAVQKAFELSAKGDQVMLSPVCASFDLFENYEDRGKQFKNCVKNL